ncbi:MAG: hypothetical protein JW917_11375 [Ignavibacteria bacterium]|nr:hypothetical protein [Ignavibacteria bacterium]
MKILKHVSSVLLIALFIALAFGSLFEDKDKEKEYKPEDDGSIRISADNLYKEYSDNPVAADEKFKGKTLKVTGNISLINQEKDGRILIMYDTKAINGYIFCYFDETESKKIAKLKPGDYRTIKGRCTGMLVGVTLEDCEVY